MASFSSRRLSPRSPSARDSQACANNRSTSYDGRPARGGGALQDLAGLVGVAPGQCVGRRLEDQGRFLRRRLPEQAVGLVGEAADAEQPTSQGEQAVLHHRRRRGTELVTGRHHGGCRLVALALRGLELGLHQATDPGQRSAPVGLGPQGALTEGQGRKAACS